MDHHFKGRDFLDSSFEHVKTLRIETTHAQLQYWYLHNVFTWRWWIIVAVSVGLCWTWCEIVDKRHIVENLFYGLLTIVLTVLLDSIGTEIPRFWYYPVRLVPLGRPSIPVDYVILPVCFMIVYQCFKSGKSFVFAITIFAATASFVGEPLAVSLGLYEPGAWRPIYSFPIYIIMAVSLRWIVRRLMKVQARQTRG